MGCAPGGCPRPAARGAAVVGPLPLRAQRRAEPEDAVRPVPRIDESVGPHAYWRANRLNSALAKPCRSNPISNPDVEHDHAILPRTTPAAGPTERCHPAGRP